MKASDFIWNTGYKEKFFVPLMLLTPLIEIFNGVIDIVIIFTPYRCDLLGWHMQRVLDSQMKKRKKLAGR